MFGLCSVLLWTARMEVSDRYFIENSDWDPCYLRRIFDTDFFDYSELWNNKMEYSDEELVRHVSNVEKYCPIVEDISLEDEVLCTAVEHIEKE